MDIYTIYRATNILTNKVYIGFTRFDVIGRSHAHLKNSKIIKTKFYNAIRKYGWNSFIWEAIYQSKDYDHTLNVMENYFIVEHDSFKNGYNSTLGGNGICGWKGNQEHKNKKQSAAKNFYSSLTSQERKIKYGHIGKENGFFGKNHSNSSIQKMKVSHKNQRNKLIKCHKCHKEVDAQNHALHHGNKCGVDSPVKGRKWYHSIDKISYYLFPSDPKIIEFNLIPGRVSKKKLGRSKEIK